MESEGVEGDSPRVKEENTCCEGEPKSVSDKSVLALLGAKESPEEKEISEKRTELASLGVEVVCL